VEDEVPSPDRGAGAAQLNRWAAIMGNAPFMFALANVGGMALYVYLCSRIVQTIQHEQRTYAEIADGIAYLVTAFPVLAFFVAVDLIWVVVMTKQQLKHRDSKAAMLFGIGAVAAWAVTFYAPWYAF